ncbi:MAG: hypothetical protein PHV28_12870 [Kiritimatiellae bacterium]|nr:hypothetical protein [Kiritimatiellia bacterium]
MAQKYKTSLGFLNSLLCVTLIILLGTVCLREFYIISLRSCYIQSALHRDVLNLAETNNIIRYRNIVHEQMLISSNQYASGKFYDNILLPIRKDVAEFDRIRFEKIDSFCRQNQIQVDEL